MLNRFSPAIRIMRTKWRNALTRSLSALPWIALVGVGVATPSFAEDADLVLRDGVFYTVASVEPVEGSLAIGSGAILYLGPDAEAWIGESTKVIDLDGRAATPGLIDAHSHLLSLGAALRQVDAVGTESYAAVIERAAATAETTPKGEWIFGRGWDQNDWVESDFPTHGALSAAVPDHPVWLRRIDGHAALLNDEAMQRLGIDTSTPDPPGGRFLRDAEGKPTGVLIDAAMTVVSDGLPDPSHEELARRLDLATEHCLAVGLTTVTEMGVTQAEVDTYLAARDDGRLGIRSALFLADDEPLLASWFDRGPIVDESGWLTLRGIKMYADGALGSRGAALVEPYTDDPSNTGLLLTSGDHVESVCRAALETGFQVGVHAIGDRGGLIVLDAFERCFGGPKADARFRIEHAQVMRLSDIERMAKLGVIASMQPTHATSDMPWAEERVGSRRIEGAYAWRRMLEAGVAMAFGSDFPVELADPRLGIYSGVSRQDLDGHPAGGWRADERMTRDEVLRAFTLGAAESLFLDQLIGSLEVGKRADVVVYGRDIMQVPETEIATVPIDMTILDGEIVYERVERTSVDR